MIWLFEDYVKDRYTEFLRALEASSHDSVLFTKKKVQNIAYDLILEKPEQEMVLLQLLVNKMGDTENKVASNSVYLMTLMLEKHPAMKLAVVKEVESFLHRPHVSLRAQYYAVIFLNQLILTKDNVDLSKKLLTIYFSMFKKLVANQRNLESKMLSALLTGVNRAFPFAPQDSESYVWCHPT
jgi:ribosome biogenesis protein MAK21